VNQCGRPQTGAGEGKIGHKQDVRKTEKIFRYEILCSRHPPFPPVMSTDGRVVLRENVDPNNILQIFCVFLCVSDVYV